jgi:hydroxyethylthiazole kinase-like uncharacterized protein yjeF
MDSINSKPDSVLVRLSDRLLRDWPLPMPPREGDKEQRGRVLIVGGCREIPGAVVLAATAALRAGAGKVTVITAESVALSVAMAVPESRVIATSESPSGAPVYSEACELDKKFDSVLIGPGLQDDTSRELTIALLAKFPDSKIVLDACAMDVAKGLDGASQFAAQVLLTPHAGELAHLTDIEKAGVVAEPQRAAILAAQRWNALVALKGATTFLAGPDGRVWQHDGGNVGLATSGSGDTLSGIIAGLAARGAPLEQAAAWGVFLHARAGEALARRLGPLGYLAREMAAEIPALMHALRPRSKD